MFKIKKFDVILYILIWFILRIVLTDGNILVYGVLTTIIYLIIKLIKKIILK